LNIFKVSVVCQDTQLFLVKSSAVIFSSFKKIDTWTSDAWQMLGTRPFPKDNKLIPWQGWSFFLEKTLKQLL